MSERVIVNDAGDLATDGEGGVLWSTDDQYLGIIDDFRVLSAVPSESVAAGNARRELDATEAAGTLCYLNFNEFNAIAPTTAYDVSGNARDAILVGIAQWVGFEGPPSFAGVRKPQVWGRRRMRTGKLVDPQRNVFQVHRGQTQQIVPLENGLDSLTYDGDFPSIYDWTAVDGHYATQLSRGLVQVNALSPSVTLAFDVWGDVDPVWGYTEVSAEIMRAVVVRQGGADAVEGIDTGAIASVAEDRPDAAGISTGDSPVSVLSLLNDLAGGIDGWWTVLTRGSRFTVGLREEPVLPEFFLDQDDILEDGLERVASASAVRQWTLTYGQFEVTVDAANVAGAIAANLRPRYSQADARQQSRDLGLDPDWIRRFKDAVAASGVTLYDDPAACRREAERRLAIDRYSRDVYKAQLPRGVFQYRVGQPGRVTYPRFNLAAGNDYRIGGYEEATDTGAVNLFLWGKRILLDRLPGTSMLDPTG